MKFNPKNNKALIALSSFVLVLVVLVLAQDYLRATIKNSAFYFSESFIFSSFWWIFAPLLYLQYFVTNSKIVKHVLFQLSIIIAPLIIHLFTFPFLVWLLSTSFYYHSFAFLQTLNYTLSEYLYQLVSLYSIPILSYQIFIKKFKPEVKICTTENENKIDYFIKTILVGEGNRKFNISVNEALYFSAATPYINIHLEGKKYLHNETLKSISNKLNPEQFIRVHKSTIINIIMVTSYTTRFNGDYELAMKNNVILRVSRNFAADFKKLYNNANRVTTK